MIRAVIFDLGHTLWDILPDRDGALDRVYDDLRARLCAELGPEGVPEAGAIRRAVGDVLRSMAEQYYAERRMEEPSPHTYLSLGCAKLGLALDDELARALSGPLFATEVDRLHCADGTVEALRELQAAGYAMGCITNTLASADTIRIMLRRHGIEPLMGSVVVSSEQGWRKPHPSLFEKALRELGVAPHESVFVGDSPWHDIEGALNAGMRAILTRQYAARQTDGFAAPHATIEHVRELPAAIAALERIPR